MADNKGKSWSLGIIIFYSVFVLALLGFWYFSTFHKIELVTDNYYEQELQYEKTITRMKNANSLAEKPYFQVDKKNKQLILTVPAELNPPSLRGKIHLFRPSDAKFDRKYNLLCDTSNRQFIPIHGLPEGKWRLKMNWTDGVKEFYIEEVINF